MSKGGAKEKEKGRWACIIRAVATAWMEAVWSGAEQWLTPGARASQPASQCHLFPLWAMPPFFCLPLFSAPPHVALKCKKIKYNKKNKKKLPLKQVFDFNFIRAPCICLHSTSTRARAVGFFLWSRSLLIFTQAASLVNTFFKMAQGQVVKERSRNESFISLRLMPSCVSQICAEALERTCVSLEM